MGTEELTLEPTETHYVHFLKTLTLTTTCRSLTLTLTLTQLFTLELNIIYYPYLYFATNGKERPQNEKLM